MDHLPAQELDRCAALLLEAGEARQPVAVPPALAGAAVEDGLQVQARHLRGALQRLGGRIAGTKLGGTSEAALNALRLAAPFTGPIFSARSQESPGLFNRADFMACIVEAEIAVRLAADLDGTREPTRDELLEAIDAVFPAIEIADSRYQGWAQASAAAIYADLGYAGAWVRGAPSTAWRDIDLAAVPATLFLDGAVVRQGSGANVLGDPLHALALAAPELARQGRALRAGDLVSLGSCTAPFPSAGGGHFVVDFGPLGQVSVHLQA